MQENFKTVKRKYFIKKVGELIKEIRIKNKKVTIYQITNKYDIDKGTLSKIERGLQNCQFVNLWKISEALGIKCSDLVKILEEELGEDFKLMDE